MEPTPVKPIPPPNRIVKDDDPLGVLLLGLFCGAAALAVLAWVLS